MLLFVVYANGIWYPIWDSLLLNTWVTTLGLLPEFAKSPVKIIFHNQALYPKACNANLARCNAPGAC